MPQNHHQSQAANFADCHNDVAASSFLLDGTTPSGQPQQQQPPIKQLFNNLYLGTPLKPSLRNMPGGIHCSAEGPSFKNRFLHRFPLMPKLKPTKI
jgi:hypothetical protein